MASRLNPYVNFDGDAREALTHYQKVFGGELDLMTFGSMGAEGDQAEQIMHGMLSAPNGFVLMGSDMPPDMPIERGNNYAISLSGDDEAELRGWFEALSEGGEVSMPLEKQMWGDVFGMCTDRWGIPWLVNISQSE